MVSIKEYAKSKGVSYEAIRKQVSRYSDELKGHISVKNRTQYLDEEAVAFLDSKRAENPVIIMESSKDEELERLKLKIEFLEAKNIELYEENRTLLKEKNEQTLLIAEAEAHKLLLEDREKELAKFKPSFFGLYRKEK